MKTSPNKASLAIDTVESPLTFDVGFELMEDDPKAPQGTTATDEEVGRLILSHVVDAA